MLSAKSMITMFMVLALIYCSMACDGHDSPCSGDNGSQGSCCGGMHCQKNDPSWRQGRCYYNPGK
ncbi:hainantoxin F5-22.36-like [Belonocnema kinseyi]|uniref:hainantoxin F5-22.36-like n=1 Tax=Belonocnema kinseyi TaxID=2817044 RepID=UPI00143D84D3|nr:hainantoxin F5-22.36-like [Belonocnema kinseyi]